MERCLRRKKSSDLAKGPFKQTNKTLGSKILRGSWPRRQVGCQPGFVRGSAPLPPLGEASPNHAPNPPFTAALFQHPLSNACSHCPYIDVAASTLRSCLRPHHVLPPTAFGVITSSFSHSRSSPSEADLRQSTSLLRTCRLCGYHPGRRHQHLSSEISNTFPTDLPASHPFSMQQPDGTYSK